MAVRLNDIRVRARQRAEQEITGAVGFIGHKELTALVNAGYAELYDLAVKTSEDYFTTTASPTITGSTITLASDFYKLRGLDIDLGGGRFAAVRPYSFQNRNEVQDSAFWLPWVGRARVEYRMIAGSIQLLPTTNAPGSYRYWYVPRLTPFVPDTLTLGGVYFECIKEGLATGAVSLAYANTAVAGSETVTVAGNAITVGIQTGVSTPTQVADAVNANALALALIYAIATGTAAVTTTGATPLAGQIDMTANIPDGWDEYMVIYAAIKMLEKEESDPGALMADLGQIKFRVENMAGDRDAGEPSVIADVRGWEGRW